MLYLAEIDDTAPWKLKSDPVLLSRPLYGWENMEGTINNEGPYTFISDDTVYLAYSGELQMGILIRWESCQHGQEPIF